jgi:predicted NBD/HSP70 family sugar kinase
MVTIELPSYLKGMTGDRNLSKALNRSILLDFLRQQSGPFGRGRTGDTAVGYSRAALAKKSGLNKATVSSQIAELIEMGIVRETGMGDFGLGRKPVMLEIDGRAGYVLGISITSESIHGITMNLAGDIIGDDLFPLQGAAPNQIVKHIQRIIPLVEKRLPPSRYGLFGLGIAVPGVVDINDEHVVRSAKLNWTNVPLRDIVAGKFKGILHIGNDATLATVAERELFGQKIQDLLCLLIDEGIGSGAYINGSIYYGHDGKFGEVGHMTIVHGGKPCPCGNIGCWDLYGTELALRQSLAGKGPIPSIEHMLTLAEELPASRQKAFHAFVGYITTGLVGLINAFAPEAVIINSAVLNVSPLLFDELKKEVAGRTMTKNPECEIRLSSLGKAAPAMGACVAVQERFFQELMFQ